MTAAEVQKKLGNRWGYLIKGFIMTMFLGILYAWSIFVAPLEEIFGWSRSETTITYSVMMVTFALGQLTGGIWAERIIKSQKWTITIFSFLLAFGFFMASFTESLMWLYVWYGGVCGYTLGVTNNCVISAAPKWFPDKAGLATGIIVLGFGLASLVLGQVANYLIGAYGYQIAMRVLAVLCFVMVTCVSLSFRLPPLGYMPEGYTPPANQSDIATGYKPTQTLRTRQFWMIYIWDFCNHFAGFMIISLIAPYGIQMGMPAALSALAVGIFGLSNGIGRPLFGAIGDKIGPKPTFILINVVMVIGMLAIAFLPGMLDPTVGIIVGAIIMGMSYGGSVAYKSACMRTFFGTKYVTANFGLIASDDLPAGILGPMVAAVIFTAAGTYFPAFLVAAAVSAIGIIFPFFVGKPIPVAKKFPNEVDNDDTTPKAPAPAKA